eukprot:gene12244-31206_t
MPTITTTVTSACATGVTTTQTTTVATPEPASAAVAVPNQLPKVSRGAVYLLNFFYFKNNADMMEFANAYLNGVQGYMNAGGCTQHAFESGETPNCLVSFFSFDVDKWVPQNDFWAGSEKVVGGLDKTDYFEANYWGADIPADLDECLQAWFVHPKNRVGADCSSTMTSFNMKKVDNDQKKVIQLAFHDSPNDLYENGVGGLIAYANQYCWANSFGKLANGKYLVLQIWETSADLEHQGAAFTPWCMGGTADAANTARWVAETDIVSYTFGGIDDSTRAVMKPYGDAPNFTCLFPTLIGGVGGEGRGLSNVMLYFPTKAVAAGARAEWKGLFAAAKAKGVKVEGSLSFVQGNDTTLNAFIHFENVSDLGAFHQIAYETPSFLDNCAKRLLHCQVENIGSMTHEVSSTFGGWESFGTCVFADTLNQQVMSKFFAESPGDSPIESIQWFETKGDITPFTTFSTDGGIQKLMDAHKVSFYIIDYGGNFVKLYFKFASSQSFADFWGEAEKIAGPKLTALVEQAVVCNLWLWGDLNDAGRAVMAKYGGLPTYVVNGDSKRVDVPCQADRC